MRDFVRDAAVFLYLLKDKLHELTSWGVDGQGLSWGVWELIFSLELVAPISLLAFSILSSDKLESYLYKDIQI